MRQHRKKILFAALVIFFYRATPGVGEGYRWFTIDVLGFDEGFYGTLAQIGAGLSLAGAWLFSDVITRQPIAKVLLWLTILGTILTLPSLALALRWDEWTEQMFGFGARTIAFVDTTVSSPFVELSMIPALTLVALNAPPGRRATWFALMASLMNVALVAGQLQTKYLNLCSTWIAALTRCLPVLVGDGAPDRLRRAGRPACLLSAGAPPDEVLDYIRRASGRGTSSFRRTTASSRRQRSHQRHDHHRRCEPQGRKVGSRRTAALGHRRHSLNDKGHARQFASATLSLPADWYCCRFELARPLIEPRGVASLFVLHVLDGRGIGALDPAFAASGLELLD